MSSHHYDHSSSKDNSIKRSPNTQKQQEFSNSTSSLTFSPAGLSALQGTVGNQAVQRLLSNSGVHQRQATSAQTNTSKKSVSQSGHVAKLVLHADTETANRSELTIAELQQALVGHSWVSLRYNNHASIPRTIPNPTQTLLRSGGTAFGFWPLVFRGLDFSEQAQNRMDRGHTPGTGTSTNPDHQGFSLSPLKNVPGRVEEPDTAHSPKASKEYDLTQTQVDDMLKYVQSKRHANYNLYTFNCTTFAAKCVESAGQTAPSGTTLGICLPNALYRDLYQMRKKGDASVAIASLGPGERHENAPKKQ